jgi:hypothetical protein
VAECLAATHPGRLLCWLQDDDSHLLRVQPAHPEPPGGARVAGRQWLGRSRPRAGGGVNVATTAGSGASWLCSSNYQHQPAHRDTGDVASQLRYGSERRCCLNWKCCHIVQSLCIPVTLYSLPPPFLRRPQSCVCTDAVSLLGNHILLNKYFIF